MNFLYNLLFCFLLLPSLCLASNSGWCVLSETNTDTTTIAIPCFNPNEVIHTGVVGFWTCPDQLVGKQIVESQVSFYKAGEDGEVDVQLTDGLVGYFGLTLNSGDRAKTSGNSGFPITLEHEQQVAVLIPSIRASVRPVGMVVNLMIIDP